MSENKVVLSLSGGKFANSCIERVETSTVHKKTDKPLLATILERVRLIDSFVLICNIEKVLRLIEDLTIRRAKPVAARSPVLS